MLSTEYRAVSNFFRNTEKLSREDLKIIVKEIIKDIVSEHIKRYFLTLESQTIIEKAVRSSMYEMKSELSKHILEELLRKCKP